MGRETDPRLWQLTVLGGLLCWGTLGLDFEVDPLRAGATLLAALATQWVCGRLSGARRFDPRSALISGLSLALLMRADAFWPLPLAAVLAVASKFAVRRAGKHVFNPSCLAIVVSLACVDGVWVSAGQWGSSALFAFAAAGFGQLVVRRAERSDVTWAFLAAWAALALGRALWLGDPFAIALHGLQNGAVLIFAFFMISDPRTIPDSRAGRVLFASAVATAAFALQFGLYQSNPLLWALAGAAPLVPWIDRWLPGRSHAWRHALDRGARPATRPQVRKEHPMTSRIRRGLAAACLLAGVVATQGDASAFCGFYVAKADTRLFNKASQVVLVRDGDRTVITMSNDFQGDPREFAMVIPVPTFVEREQIHVGERAVIEHLDAYTAPRLVEYHDPNPCAVPYALKSARDAVLFAAPVAEAQERSARAEGVHIEASYSVGEYDVLILSAEESGGLTRWLRGNGYRLPDGAEPILRSYLKQGMRFFVAKVDLEQHDRLGFSYLRPLQVAYESPKFMLPIRLGTLNADGTQELFVYTLTRKGRVETTNYRTVKLPTGMDVPTYVKDDFASFYTALFDEQVEREDMRVVFTEYAWDMAWCDPCAADPLSRKELGDLGVFWLEPGEGPAPDVFVTRLHVRYDAEHFPADLVFQETGDRSNFQGRYVVRHPYTGEMACPQARAYREEVERRREREAQTLASLTGWDMAGIRARMGRLWHGSGTAKPWWQGLWRD